MTTTSRLPALIDYLVALFTGAATLGQAAAPVTVYDGPATTGLDAQLKLFVGLHDPDSVAAEEAGGFTQSWAALGRLGRDEEVTIHCCAEAWAGTDDLKTVRVAVTGIVAAVETLMQADTTQFGGNALFPDPGITAGVLMQANTQQGAVARLAFDLIFKCRIGGLGKAAMSLQKNISGGPLDVPVLGRVVEADEVAAVPDFQPDGESPIVWPPDKWECADTPGAKPKPADTAADTGSTGTEM